MKFRSFFLWLILPALALLPLGGCRTPPWTRGSVTAVLPQHVEKCRADTAFCVEMVRKEKRVKARLEEALRARGFEVVEKRIECDVVVKVEVTAWETNDAGFSGFGQRDDMQITVALVDRRRQTIMGRWRVVLKSDFRILDRCVEEF